MRRIHLSQEAVVIPHHHRNLVLAAAEVEVSVLSRDEVVNVLPALVMVVEEVSTRTLAAVM